MNQTPAPVESIFGRAPCVPSPAEQAADLDEACASDPQLRAEVEALLQALQDGGSFLKDRSAASVATVDEPMREAAGTVIGSYKLLEQIGEGGFGIGFLAEQQEPVRRKGALKVLKAGMDSKQDTTPLPAPRPNPPPP